MNFYEVLKQLPIERFRNPAPVVAVLRFEGVIAPRPSRNSVSRASHAAAIERAFSVFGLRAVALSINSPGGSPVQSALLFRRIRQLAAEKGVSVFAFAEDVAASGGHCLAVAGGEGSAEESSLVGPIGVVSSRFTVPPPLRSAGIQSPGHT